MMTAADVAPVRLSAIIITKNEAENLADCLDSLAFCDEIVVVDSGSTDGTLDIARSSGARIIEREWPGFGPQKEFARQQAHGEWVLSLDADERVPPALRAEIEAALATPSADAYAMPRLSTFLGRPMRHSGWWPDYCLRLFRKDSARFSLDPVHESVKTDRPVARLTSHIEHHPVRRIEDLMRKMDSYSTLGAKTVVARGRHVSALTPWLHAAGAFVGTYLLKCGFLDGPEGLLNARVHARTVFWKYSKARRFQRGKG